MVRLYTNYGPITIELDHERAPKTAANFENYVRNGFYDGTLFHRVINGFMIQGGGFEPGMRQKTAEDPIENEARNGLRNAKYTVAMARTGDPHSASSQFFINVADNEFLNHTSPSPQGWGYCVFGKVIEGTDTVDKIKVHAHRPAWLASGRARSQRAGRARRDHLNLSLKLTEPPPALAVTQSIEPLVDPIFISDLHLALERPATLQRFFRFMQADAPRHRELVILGDLFEFWIGDDASPPAKPVDRRTGSGVEGRSSACS